MAPILALQIAPNEPNATTANDYIVYKVGRRTARTVGQVIEIDAMDESGNSGIIVIAPTALDCLNIDRFDDHGNSGSALINDQRQLVGLVYAKDSPPNDRQGLACHIHPVMDRLGVTPISEANPPVGPAGHARSDQVGRIDDTPSPVLELKRRVLDTPRGTALAAFMEHWDEIMDLVNHCRPVTVAWHRAKGPAFVAHLSENAARPRTRSRTRLTALIGRC